ncbi:glycerophosphodiester phosphodiesterase family protein [Paraclostridium sordellii]|uniref:glycerophosphodiester phosphodiesterase family protein n=1 Tax=Paraclostridium sordellii TaxID=1505 RepID=UPI0005E7CFA1|nr:glycerophosphodiester phosphodiesterase family protein [Paeniclostridium sordellii]CEO21092.1 glycerophosphoryl diester phosphodiesterase [[Clostridium] sordellii] [Paeniclostridium sordellii]
MAEDKKKYINKLPSFKLRRIWLYTKYQLITKLILAIAIFPLYRFAIEKLIQSSGRTNISSGDYLSFLFSFNGAGLLVLTLILMTILIAMDINAFIIMSALIKEKRIYMRTSDMFYVAIKSIKSFVSPHGFLLMIYVSLIFPIIGLGITISPMKDFQIPNFITSVIYNNPLYEIGYMALILVLTFIGYKLIFSFHYIVICGYSAKESIKKSSQLIKRYKLDFFKNFIISEGLRIIGAFIFILALVFLAFEVSSYFISNQDYYRIALIFSLLLILEFITYILFIFVPLMIERLTNLFYKYNEKDNHPVVIAFDIKAYTWNRMGNYKIKIKTKIIVLLLLAITLALNLLFSVALSLNFDILFKQDKKIEIIAHRGGGNLGAENTLEGVEKAIKEKANWTEIDVQRTKDNHYIINHDKNFKRLTGESRSPKDMTLKEIKSLWIKNEFDISNKKQKVATLDEMIDLSKGKIGLFIELKGATADKKMADEVVKKVKENKIEKEAVILSLDYSLIQYIEKKYPDIETGYLYFFSVGERDKMVGDYLIMEEREATFDNIYKIHQAKKKAVVWTVNTKQSMEKFINMPVDGIITDYVKELKHEIKVEQNRSDIEIIIDEIFGFE